MRNRNIKNIRQLKIEEIYSKINETRREIFDLKFKKATRQTIKTHKFKSKKHYLAQLLMVKQEKQE